MILKKPYAFLIKHFKLIHLLLTLLLGVIAYLTIDIISFFQTYVSSGYRQVGSVSELARLYTPTYLYVLIILALGVFITLLVLMVHKKKPCKLYIIAIIYYLYILVGLFIVTGILNGFQTALLEAKIARSVRDVVLLTSIPQYIFIICTGIRSTGFNLKKFDFQNDIRELNLNAADAQEFELKLNIDFDLIKRKINHIFRNLVYYFKENKFIFICIITALVVGLVALIVTNRVKDPNRTFNINQEFSYNSLRMKVNKVMVTNMDYNGDPIIEDSFYVVLDLSVTNTGNSSYKLDYNNFKLQIGKKMYTPEQSITKYFEDFTNTASPNVLVSNRDYRYAIVYKIDSKDKNKAMKWVIYNGSVTQKKKQVFRHIYVNLKTESKYNPSVGGNYTLGEEINFKDTYLGNTTLMVKDYEFKDSYLYEYEACFYDDCKKYKDKLSVNLKHPDYKLLIVKADYKPDTSTMFYAYGGNLRNFISKFVDIEYKIDETVYTDKAIHVTPQNATNFIAFEVPPEMENASIIQFTITIRDKTYYINLKLN